MKTRNKILAAVFTLAVLFNINLKAQEKTLTPSVNSFDYNNAIGVRAGETSGLTFKHMFNGGHAFEGIVSFWPYTIGVTGLYEKYMPTTAPGLNWYFGAGAHINAGSPRYKAYYLYRDHAYVYAYNANAFAVGIDGVLGLEYKFKPIPFAISADIKPYIETGNFGYSYFTLDPGIGLKFTF